MIYINVVLDFFSFVLRLVIFLLIILKLRQLDQRIYELGDKHNSLMEVIDLGDD